MALTESEEFWLFVIANKIPDHKWMELYIEYFKCSSATPQDVSDTIGKYQHALQDAPLTMDDIA